MTTYTIYFDILTDSTKEYYCKSSRTGTTIFTNTDCFTLLNSLNTSIGSVGGKIHFEKYPNATVPSEYIINDKIWWGNDSFPTKNIVIEGETEDVTLKAASNFPLDTTFMTSRNNITFQNLTLDGVDRVSSIFETGYGINTKVSNVTFKNHRKFGIWTSENALSTVIQYCKFYESPGQGDDQCAVDAVNYVNVSHNYFDMSQGLATDGSSLTSGRAKTMVMSDNVILRNTEDLYHGMSMEGFGDCESVIISNNLVENGTIAIGDLRPETAAYKYKRIEVIGNSLKGGHIAVHGSNDSSWVNNNIQNVVINSNEIVDPQRFGIYVLRASGNININGNILRNSNMEGFSGSDYYRMTPICLEHTKKVNVSNNIIQIDNLSSQYKSPAMMSLYHNNALVNINGNTFIHNGANTVPFINYTGSDNWAWIHENLFRNTSGKSILSGISVGTNNTLLSDSTSNKSF